MKPTAAVSIALNWQSDPAASWRASVPAIGSYVIARIDGLEQHRYLLVLQTERLDIEPLAFGQTVEECKQAARSDIAQRMGLATTASTRRAFR